MDQPEGPPNKKGRKFGHGTTSQAREERRKGMQWSALEKADPTDPTVLAKHLEALEKAKARCQERMADAVTKKLEQLSTSDEPRAGGAKHRGKSGQPRKAVLTPAAAAASSSSGLEKPTATLEKEGKKKKSKPAQDLEKSKPKDLEKSQGSTTHGSATKGLERPVVVVDWHNTLEKDNVVSQDNLAGLEKLQEHCTVILLSAVDTAKRQKQVLVDMDAMIPDHIHQKGLGKETCWEKCGEGGKADLAWLWDAVAIFDDNLQICQECEAWGIDAYQVSQKKGAKGAFPTFWKAVDAFLVGENLQ